MDLGPAGPVLWFLLGYIATRILDSIKPKRQHVLGAAAMGTGWTGLFFFSAETFVWNLYIVPTNLLIAIHSGFSGMPRFAGVLLPNLNFGLAMWLLVILTLNGIVKFSETRWPAKAVRAFPILNRYVAKRINGEKPKRRYYHYP